MREKTRSRRRKTGQCAKKVHFIHTQKIYIPFIGLTRRSKLLMEISNIAILKLQIRFFSVDSLGPKIRKDIGGTADVVG